jgi:DNA gyrase subunit A
MEIVSEGAQMLTVTERGFGKRTDVGEYRVQGRGGKGIINIRVTDKNGPVVGIKQVREEDGVMMISQEGKVTRLRVREIRDTGRAAQGVRLQGLEEGDRVAAVTAVVMEEEEVAEAGPEPVDGTPEPGEGPPGLVEGDEPEEE